MHMSIISLPQQAIMKNWLYMMTILWLFVHSHIYAQAPQKINYQGIARDNAGAPYPNQPLGLRLSIHDISATGTIQYQETHTITTNAYGLYNVAIGTGSVTIGSFPAIGWGAGDKYIQVEIDPTGGNNYIQMGTTQMLSVPYALYAANGGGPTYSGGTGITISGTTINSTWTASGANIYNNNPGNIGIGTTAPTARLHVADSSAVFTASGPTPANAGNTPITGAGRRMMWYADKAAFRAGYVTGNNWNKDSIGNYSFATGYDSKAVGSMSAAIGAGTVASGIEAIALGYNSLASGNHAMAAGNNTKAIYDDATAMGNLTVASGSSSTAMGAGSTASGSASVAMGYNTTASGSYAVAAGVGVVASGDNSIAIGGPSSTASGSNSTALGSYVSTNGFTGSFVIGDNSTAMVMNSDVSNQMVMRFAGGYKLFSNTVLSTGVQLLANSNSWSVVSDRRKKENFLEINGDTILAKISAFKLCSWNYKGQDPEYYRHYGPMAQDFYSAFGKDRFGYIGNDTTINQADLEGISFMAIQALEKRSRTLTDENEDLRVQIAFLKEKYEMLSNTIELIQETNKHVTEPNILTGIVEANLKVK